MFTLKIRRSYLAVIVLLAMTIVLGMFIGNRHPDSETAKLMILIVTCVCMGSGATLSMLGRLPWILVGSGLGIGYMATMAEEYRGIAGILFLLILYMMYVGSQPETVPAEPTAE